MAHASNAAARDFAATMVARLQLLCGVWRGHWRGGNLADLPGVLHCYCTLSDFALSVFRLVTAEPL